MPIEQDLRKALTDALKARDGRTADVVRMIMSKVTERRTAESFKGEVDDVLHLDVIAAYKKSLQKAREQYLAAGERGAEHAAALQWETELCDRFLPQGLGADEIRAAVVAAIAATGAKDVKMAGRVVGEVMKANKGKVDAAAVKKIAEEELAKAPG